MSGGCGRLHEREEKPGSKKRAPVDKLTHVGGTYEHKEGDQGPDQPYNYDKNPQTVHVHVSGSP